MGQVGHSIDDTIAVMMTTSYILASCELMEYAGQVGQTVGIYDTMSVIVAKSYIFSRTM